MNRDKLTESKYLECRSNPLVATISGGGALLKVLTAAVFAGCIVYAGQPVSAVSIPQPTLDVLHNSNSLIPETNDIYPASVYYFNEIEVSDSNNIPVNVVKYYDPNSIDEKVHYYEVLFKSSEYGQGSSAKYYKWTKDSGIIKLEETTNVSEAVLTVKYDSSNPTKQIDVPSNTTEFSINEVITSQDIKKFISVGGTVNSISSTFVGNNLEISKEDSSSYDYSLIYTENTGKINNITSSFIGNTINVAADSGTIFGTTIKALGPIDNINSEFIGNMVTSSNTRINGGLIESVAAAEVQSISSDFIRNGVTSVSGAIEGALIANSGTINAITGGQYIENYAVSQSGNVSGGVIWNEKIIGGISDVVFNGNYVKSGSGSVQGGVLYNSSSITNGISNTIFTGNYAQSDTGVAHGGAIYTDSNLTIKATDGKITEFTDNYVINNGVKTSEAIYVDSSTAMLTLQALSGGNIILNDAINGKSGYTVNITGDGNGTVAIYNDITNGNIIASNTNIDMADGNIFDYNFLSLKSDGSVKFSLDVDYENSVSDTITIASGSGTIYIDNINILSGSIIGSSLIQILNAPDTISIALSDDFENKQISLKNERIISDTIKADALWSDVFGERTVADEVTETYSVTTSSSGRTNADSLEYKAESKVVDISIDSYGDTLKLLNTYSDAGDRSFKAVNVGDVYTVSEDLGTTTQTGVGNTFTVSGVRDGDNISTIDANGHTLFEINNDATNLVLSNVAIKNAADKAGSILNITNAGGSVELQNKVTLTGSGTATGIVNEGTIRSNGSVTSSTGIDGGGNLVVDGGSMTFTDGTSITQAAVTVNNGADLTMRDGGAINSALSINSGSVRVGADGLKGTVLNNGSLYLTDGTLETAITTTGTNAYTYIDGNVTSNALISTIISMTNGSELITNANNLGGTIENGETVNLTGGTVANAIVADTLNITSGEVTIQSNGVNATNFNVLKDAKLITSAENIHNDIINNSIVQLTGGALTKNISGTGSIEINGAVTYSAAVTQDTNIIGGMLTTNAGFLTGTTIINDSVLALTDGTLDNTIISGENGRIQTSGSVYANSKLTQPVQNSGTLYIGAENIGNNIYTTGKIIITTSSDANELYYDITGADDNAYIQIRGENPLYNYGHLSVKIWAQPTSLYSNASLLSGSTLFQGAIYLTGGTLENVTISTENLVPGQYTSIYIPEDAVVNINIPIPGILSINSGGTLNISADNILPQLSRNINNSGTINLDSGTLDSRTINNVSSSIYGTLNIIGKVDVVNSSITNNIVVTEDGELTISANVIQGNSTLTNNGRLNLNGSLTRCVEGDGITYINDNLTLANLSAGFTGELNLNDGSLATVANSYNTYNLGTVTGEGDLSFNLSYSNSKSDKFSMNVLSDGIFNVTNINISNMNNIVSDGTTKTFQILTGGSAAQLQFETYNQDFTVSDFSEGLVAANVYFDDEYIRQYREGVLHTEIKVATTTSDNDSISITALGTDWGEYTGIRGALLTNWNQLVTTEERNFNFKSGSDVYPVIEDLGNSTAGILNINGVYDEENDTRSTIDMAGHDGFSLSSGRILNIYNTEFINGDRLIYATQGSMVGEIVNSVFSDNTTTLEGGTGASYYPANIYLDNSSISQIKDSIIKNNSLFLTATEEVGSYIVYGATLFMKNTQLAQDTYDGGIINTVFEGNNITGIEGGNIGSSYGGGLYNGASGYISNIKNSKFLNNYIKVSNIGNARGGAIYNNGEIYNIENTLFDGNRVYSDGSMSGAYWGGALYNMGDINIIQDSTFNNNSAGSYRIGYGGAIYNSKIITTIDNCIFSNNTSQYQGGVINSIGTIDLISNSTFSNNTAYFQGSAIANTGVIKAIEDCLFEGNFTRAEDDIKETDGLTGVLYTGGSQNISISGTTFKNNGIINECDTSKFNMYGGDIYFASNQSGSSVTDCDFIDTNISGFGSIRGGAILVGSNAQLSEISDSIFDGTKVSVSSGLYGGVLLVQGVVDSINNCQFINSDLTNTGNSLYGGVLSLYSDSTKDGIGEINNCLFSNNKVVGWTSTYGGAIYIPALHTITNGIINSSFTNNYLGVTGNNVVHGAAIYTAANLSIIATGEGGLSEFTGNYIQDKTSNKQAEAIYVAQASATLTLDANDGGRILLNDYIDGVTGYNVSLTGDKTGTISLYNNITNAIVSAANVNIDTVNNKVFAYDFNTLTSSDTARYHIDVDFLNKTSDTFKIGNSSSGRLVISEINTINDAVENSIVQILQSSNSNIQLVLDETTLNVVGDVLTSLSAKVYDDSEFRQKAGYELATTNTLNDSIKYYVEKDYDTLNLIGAATQYNYRIFEFQTQEDYNVSQNLDALAAGTLAIVGLNNDNGELSVIDADGHSLFNLTNKTELQISNTKLTGAQDLISITNEYAAVNLTNAYIDGNINGAGATKININGTDTTTITGNVTGAQTTLSSGTLVFGEETFASSTDVLNVSDGQVKLANGEIEEYNINKLVSGNSATYSIDVDLENFLADTININDTSSSGVINITDVNFINTLSAVQEFELQIINTNDNDKISINLDNYTGRYYIEDIIKSETDTVRMTTKYTDTYNDYTVKGVLVGELKYATIETINDGIKFALNNIWETSKEFDSNLGDTLKLVNQSEEYSERTFISEQATDVYNVGEDLGQTSGTLNLRGVTEGDEQSTIDLHNNLGFELGKDTTLNIYDTRITGAEDLITVTDSSAVINLENATLNGNIQSEVNYNLNISGTGTTTISGILENANTTLSKGSLSFATDTFADESNTLNLEAGSVILNNGELENYTISNLFSSENIKYSLDVDLTQELADTISVGEGSFGVITLESFNFIGSFQNVQPDDEYTIKILDAGESDVTLALSEYNQSALRDMIKLGTDTVIIDNPVEAVVNWQKKFNVTQREISIWGQLDLKSSVDGGPCDSLYLYNFDLIEGEEVTDYGDTLKLLNQFETEQDRSFNFDTAYDKYVMTDYLGTTTGGNLSINGVAATDADGNIITDENGYIITSTIDMGVNTGFGVSNETTNLTISNVTFENINYKNGSLINVSNPEAQVNLSNVIVAETICQNAISNAGKLNMTGGQVVLNSGIIGTGITNVTGADVILGDGISITQQYVNVESGSLTLADNGQITAVLSIGENGLVTVNSEGLTSASENDGTINLTGGTLTQNITGTGTTKITGNVVNTARLEQNVNIESGLLTTSADNITRTIENNADLLLTGTLDKTITGDGTTAVDQNITLASGAGVEGTLDLNDGAVLTADGSINSYNIGTMTGTGNFSIDVDIQNKAADKFVVGDKSSGTVYIDSLNFLNINEEFDTSNTPLIIQVLNTNGTDAIQLALSDELNGKSYQLGTTSCDEKDNVNAKTSYDDLYRTYIRYGTVMGSLSLGDTGSKNDSLQIEYEGIEWDKTNHETGYLGDTLALWNTLETEEDKEFYFNEVKTYTVGLQSDVSGLGETGGANVKISGVSNSETEKSTIDLNNKTGFELTGVTEFTVSNAKLTGNKDSLISVSNTDASITLNDAYIDGNITGNNLGENTYNVEISGEDVTTLNGLLANADTTLSGGTLKMNTNTFAAGTDSLTANKGNIALSNSNIEEYYINNLDSNENVNYSIDINLLDKTSDTIHVNSGSGIITLDTLNIIGTADKLNEEYKIQILFNTPNSDLQLALSANAQDSLSEEYLIGKSRAFIYDEVKAVTNWKDLYNKYYQDTFTYGKLTLATTKTENDSLGISVSDTKIGDKILEGQIGDTLKMVNNAENIAEKTFEFDSASDKYQSIDNLGSVKGIVNIAGVKEENTYSTINMNSLSGFEITEESELNISNTSITNSIAEQGSVINATSSEGTINLTNVSLTSNTSTGEHGAAIYSNSDVAISADNGVTTISNNTTSTDNEAIYMGEDTTLTLISQNGGSIILDDKVNGETGYQVKLTGDSDGDIYLNNSIDNANVEMDSITLHLSQANSFEASNMTINSGTLDLVNNSVQQQVAQSFTVNGSFNLNVDVDLKNQQMDRLPENTIVNNGAIINVDRINLLSDTTAAIVAIPFANSQFKDNVEYIGSTELSKVTQVTTAYSPIYKYSIKYENREDLGYFVFGKGAGASMSTSGAYNPSVLASPVAAQAGSYAAMNESLNYAFEHSDNYMLLPSQERFAMQNANRYAISEAEHLPFNTSYIQNNGIWVHSYANFENMPLRNGPKVNVTSYGTLVGGDSPYKELRNGWGTVTTAYAGYNGSSQSFSGVHTYQNGGLLGATQTFYKNNFFTALTLSAGASVGDAHTMYGHENFTSLMAGIASKSGYDLEFKEGKYIIQPSMLMSYTFINTFDYTNAAGVRINSDPLHTIQLHPSVKFIGNYKNGWQPYARVGMVWNILNETQFMANSVKLPEMSIKPYVEYGLGVQKRMDRFTGFAQAMIRNGGRNGIALTAGFRWALGNENIENAQDQGEETRNISKTAKRVIIKQLTADEKTTRTTKECIHKYL